MKTNISIFGVLLFFAISNADAQYYYSDNRQIALNVDSSKILILFSEDPFQFDDFIQGYPRIDSVKAAFGQDGFKVTEINSGTNLDQFLDSLLADPRVSLANPYFINSQDSALMVGRTICCKFGDNVSYDFIDSLNNEYDIEIVYENDITPKQFLLSVKDNAEYSTLEIANIYYELEETEFSHPNFLGGLEWHSYFIYDHYWEEQWAMHRIFRAYPGSPDSMNHRVFEITSDRDSNIVVAVLDQGVGPHDDMPSHRLMSGYDFAMMDDDPSPCDYPDLPGLLIGGHGQCVAGILAASQNREPDSIDNPDTGIYGIVPSCKILPVKIGNGFRLDVFPDNPGVDSVWINFPSCRGYYFADAEHLAGAISWAWTHGADIISMSWGGKDPFDVLHFAVQQATSLGRNGKGCGLFASSGNTYPYTYYPALYPEVISVISLHPDDSIWSYCSLSNVDICAPAGPKYLHQSISIWSDDLMGAAGYNTSNIDYGCGDPDDDDYMCKFGGTSSAQPVAAGVAALVLAARPDLTREQLYDVIRNSADNKLYDTITSPPDPKYGYGMVHPMRALLAVSRGDANNDHSIDMLDILYLIDFVYNSGPEPTPHPLMGDANGSGSVNLMDMLYLISYLYDNPPGPPPPISFNYGEYEF
jgi:subtilisin family serine protease